MEEKSSGGTDPLSVSLYQVLLRYTVMKIYFTRGVFLKRKKGLGVERYKKDV